MQKITLRAMWALARHTHSFWNLRKPQALLFAFIFILFVGGWGVVYGQTQTQTYLTSGTFTVPEGVTSLTVEVWGGGGRGGTRTSGTGTVIGGGGGGGAYARKVIGVTPGLQYAYNVGAGSNSNTQPGGDSWFETPTTAMAKGGNSAAANSGIGAAGGLGSASIGDQTFNGGGGANAGGGGSSAGTAAAGTTSGSASGGVAPTGGGNGGNAGNLIVGGTAGAVPGGGGGGGWRGVFGTVTQNPGSGATGQIKITYEAPAPSFTSHPQPQNIGVGSTINLSAAATLANSYQWKKNGVVIPSATGTTYSIPSASLSDAGHYSVDATNVFWTVSSNAAAIVVNPLPTVSPSSSAAAICEGGSVNLSAGATLNSTPSRVLLNENFNATANGWKTINSSTGGTAANSAWTLRPVAYIYLDPNFNITFFASNDLSQFYLSNSQSQGGGTTSTILQSPGFSTMGMSAASLSFYQYYRANGSDNIKVEVSTDGNSWTTLSTTTATQGAAAGFVQATIPLNSYAGQPLVYIRFKYDASNDYFWAIDNVNITGTMSAAPVYSWTSVPPGFTSAVASPASVFPPGTTIYNVNVTNHYGLSASGATQVQVNPFETFYADLDGDTYGNSASSTQSCFGAPIGFVSDDTDCNDANPAMHEYFDFYADADADGYGADGLVEACAINALTPPIGFTLNNTDCNDAAANAHPGAPEIGYDLLDNDCDGLTDEGFPPKFTVLHSEMCNSVLEEINSQLVANIVAGAQGYQWRVTTMSGPTAGDVQFIDTQLRVMRITQLARYAFDTTYRIELAVYYAGFLQPYKSSNCTVTTPATVTELIGCDAGVEIFNLSDIIAAHIVPFATGYRFRITDPLNPLFADQELERSLREFRMTGITDFTVLYGKTYNVQTAVRNTDGTYLPYGPVCTVTTPIFPTTSIQESQCDNGVGAPYQVPNFSTQIFASSFPRAIAYAFKLVGPGLPSTGAVVIKNLRVFTLSDFAGAGLLPGESYNLSVRLIFNVESAPGPYGKVCMIQVPGTSRPAGNTMEVVAHPNPFTDTASLLVDAKSQLPLVIKVYDLMGRTLEIIDLSPDKLEDLKIGERYPSGVYVVSVTQQEITKTIRIIKR